MNDLTEQLCPDRGIMIDTRATTIRSEPSGDNAGSPRSPDINAEAHSPAEYLVVLKKHCESSEMFKFSKLDFACPIKRGIYLAFS